jgi:hypothetical protein
MSVLFDERYLLAGKALPCGDPYIKVLAGNIYNVLNQSVIRVDKPHFAVAQIRAVTGQIAKESAKLWRA